MFTISEELLLLAFDDDKGTVVFSASDSLSYGLAGAILAELAIMGRIELEDKKIIVIDDEKTGISFLDNVLTEMIQSAKNKKVDSWIQHITSNIGQIRQDVIHQLVDKGVLKEEEKKVLWLFNQNTYPTNQDVPEWQIRKKVHTTLFGDGEPDARTVMLLSLIKSCNLIEEVFSKAERKEAKKRIEKLIENHDYGKAVKASIEEMQTAVIVACTTIVTVSVIST